MGVSAAYERRVQHPRQYQIADKARATGQQDPIFKARDLGAKILRADGCSSRDVDPARNDIPQALHCNRNR
jgi:hypothetical protein